MNQNKTSFGFGGSNTTSAFGQPAQPAQQTNTMFGNTPAQPQTNSLFGGPAQQQNTSIFGQTSQANSTMFGTQNNQANQNKPLFGGTTNTGIGQTNTGSGLFGNTPNTGTTFGTSTMFGATNAGTTAFGNTNTATGTSGGMFGNSGTNAFGTTNTGTTGFGTNTGFGAQTQNQTGFGGFGTPSTFGMTSGTSFGTAPAPIVGTTVKYQPQTASDNMVKNGSQVAIQIKLNCITCMPEYNSKCIDELRIEDYAANRKAPQMGSTANSGGLFSSSTMGNAGSSLFNQTSTGNTFGSTTNTGPFGANTMNQNKTAFGFGQTNTTSAFGQPAQPAQQTNTMFGNTTAQPQTNSMFGTPAQQQNTSIFGQTSQANSTMFGTPNNQANQNKPLFGGTTNTGFGQTNTGSGLFGNTANTGAPFGTSTSQPSLFATNQPVSTSNTMGSFGASKPLFGNSFATTSTAPAFGTATSSTTMFGTTNTGTNAFGGTNTGTGTSGGLFTNSGTNAFGTTNTGATGFGTNNSFGTNTGFGTQTQTGFGNFGNATSNFGTPATNTNPTTGFGTGLGTGFGSTTSNNAFGTNNSFGTNNTFGGGTNLFGNNTNNSLFGPPQQQQQQQAQTPLSNTVNTQQVLTRLETMPYGFSPQLPVDSIFKPNTIQTMFTTNPKTLNQYKIDAISHQKSPGIIRIPNSLKPASMLFDGLDDENVDSIKCANDIFSPRTSVKKLVLNKKGDMSLTPQSLKLLFSPKVKKFQNDLLLGSTPKMESTRIADVGSAQNATSPKAVNDTMAEIQQFENQATATPPNQKAYNSVNGSPDLDLTFGLGQSQSGDDSLIFGADETEKNCAVPNCGIILRRPEYFTIPTLEECDEFYNPEKDTCVVNDFTVVRHGYGSIYWKGPIDVKGLNLDDIVHIRRKEAIVYPDDDLKPPHGQGLNRPAQITLEKVWPINKCLRTPIKDKEILAQYAERLEAATLRLDAIFKEYRPETGSWVFNVKHFSKYGLEEDDDDDVDMESQKLSILQNINNVEMPLKSFPKEFNQETFASKVESFQNINSKPALCEQNGLAGDGFNNESKENGFFNKSFEKNAEIERMQNVLFDDDNDDEDYELLNRSNVLKKAKNSSFNKSQTVITKIFPAAPLIPSSLRTFNVKKRVLRINYQFEKALCHINSLHMASCSRVQFLNGSNRFCFVSGKSVFVMDCDIANIETPKNIDQLGEHLHGEVFVESSVPIIPVQRKSPDLLLSNGLTRSMNDLIQALFGQLNEQLPYSRYQERLQRIKNWLISYNKRLEVPRNDPWVRILHFLTTNEISFAVTECQNTANNRLGFLVASSASNDCSDKLRNMLEMWKMTKYDTKINVQLLKIYALLAGVLEWTTSDGKTICVLEDLHWTQQLLLILLYCEEPISDADLFALNPVTFSISKMLAKPNDVEYHLLAQHSPWIALSCSDMFLNLGSFFLHETLSSFNVITQDRAASLSDSIYLYMASQVNDLRWSIFFVVHVYNELVRLRFVTDLLMKNASQLLDANVELFLVDNFHIDTKLIEDAKLVYKKNQCEPKVTAQLLLDSGVFSQAHEKSKEISARIFKELCLQP